MAMKGHSSLQPLGFFLAAHGVVGFMYPQTAIEDGSGVGAEEVRDRSL
jgi:hypothetical protein